MKMHIFLGNAILALLLPCVLALKFDEHAAFTPDHLRQLKLETKQVFRHAWNSYMSFGFPADEVRPISCRKYGPDYDNPLNMRNDALANVSLTVIDNLDLLFVMEAWDQLELVLDYLHQNQATLFEQDTIVQVFEALIRWLGGLLSTHLLLTDVPWPDEPRYARIRSICEEYDGFLLVLAYDLGNRLIPAYRTETNLPLPRVNLAKGIDAVPNLMNDMTCTSGVTTPYVEFTLLSRLTGDKKFEKLTSISFWKIWNSRSPLGLLAMTINPVKSEWIDSITGIGALVDSFYEYALKGSIIFNDKGLWLVFTRAYMALLSHLAQSPGIHDPTLFTNVHTETGETISTWIDSLGAFWAGVQVLAGRLTDAILSHLIYVKMWDFFDSVPERWNFVSPSSPEDPIEDRLTNAINLEWYPLRPEFIESTYYLFRATRDPMYLQIGQRILLVFKSRFMTYCGLAGYQDVKTGKFQDRMESFVMGELLKYLYLLFDEASEVFLHQPFMSNKNWVFSTEAHPLWYTPEYGAKSTQKFKETLGLLQHHAMSNETSPFKRSFIQTILLKFASADRKMVDQLNEPPFDRVDIEIDWAGLGVKAVKDSLEALLQCETRPKQLQKQEKALLHSGYYTWKNLFQPESKYQNTLVRPPHLQKHAREAPNHYIELTPAFFHTYTTFYKEKSNKLYLQCARATTTKETDCVFGGASRPEDHQMYIIEKVEDGSRLSVNDVVMPVLSGRFRMEVLTLGKIDSTNTLITREYIKRVRPDTWVSKKSEVLRVIRANGVNVGRYRTVWTMRKSLDDAEMFKVSKDGRVFVQGRYVENLRIF